MFLLLIHVFFFFLTIYVYQDQIFFFNYDIKWYIW